MVREYQTYNIREAIIEDLKQLDTIVKVVNDAYNVSNVGWTTPKHIFNEERTNNKKIQDLVQTNGTTHVLYFALDGETIVGTIMFTQPDEKGEAYCSLLAVAPAYQSKGVGGQLFRYILNQMTKRNIETATLSTFAGRTEVIAWYKKLGFIEEPEKVDFSWHYKDA
ncbi:hypothetical protein INT45_007749, partial [Circinella minor]